MKELPRTWFVIGGLVLAVVGVDLVRRFYGLPVALLGCAAALLITVIVLMWNSLQSLDEKAHMTLDEALTLAAPAAEEEQKRAVLRSLKDLEYERRVGKVQDEDYAALASRYRSEARTLLDQLDARYEPIRRRLGEELAQRVRQAASAGERPLAVEEPETTTSREDPSRQATAGAVSDRGTDEDPSAPQRRAESAAAVPERTKAGPAAGARGPTRRCTACAARNELSANDCATCGAALARADERLCRACPARYSADTATCPECDVPAEGP